jgi:hypothetical protein
VAVEYSAFAGWKKNLKLANDSVELIVTLEVGPRIISYRSLQGRNVFKWMEEEARTSGEKEWKIRGGHRFWVGPEDFGKKESLSQNGDEALRQWIEPYVRQLLKRRVSDDEGTP